MTDFEICPVGTVKKLEAEIERLREELNVTRLQRDAKLSSQTAVDEAAAREIERLKQGIDRWARECRIRDKEIERLKEVSDG